MKAKEFLFHITWMWLWVMTSLVCIQWVLSADGAGLIAVFGLFMGGMQCGVQCTVLSRRFGDLVYGVDQ